ncbi:MAG: PAS domain S-box protein [Luteolibacter sp.]
MSTSPPTTPASPELTPGLLRRAFPFFIEWDSDLRIRSVGPSLGKICADAVPGALITGLFKLRRPIGEMTPEFFRASSDLLFLFEIIGSRLVLRGEVASLEDSNSFLMLAAPWISDPEEVERLGLTLTDFAIHDQTMDLLQVVQTQRMVNDDLQALAAKLTAQRTLLREKEAEARKLAIVASRTDNAVIVSDAEGHIEWVNDGFEGLTGWTLPEVLGKKPGTLLQGAETDPATVQHMHSQLSRGEGFKVELINYSKTGRKYWITSEVQPIRDAAGEITNFMAIQSDITDRKEADRVLRETNSLQRAMLEGAGFAFISTDAHGFIQLFNPAAERMLGYSLEEVLRHRMTPAAFHLPEEVSARAAQLSLELNREVLPGFETFVAKAELGQPDLFEWNYVRKDGSRLPVLLSVTALRDDGGTVSGYLGIASDLTERRRNEEQLRTTLSEVELLNRVMMTREERVLELKREINTMCLHANRAEAYPSAGSPISETLSPNESI